MSGHRSFRPSPTPMMQTAFFLGSIAIAVTLVVIMSSGISMPRRIQQRVAVTAVLAVLSNVPWLILCQAMRRRLIRRMAWAERGLCAWCGYDTSGLQRSAACPECGRTTAESRAALVRSASLW